MIESIIEQVDELLNTYTLDEAGQAQRDEYIKMGDLDKLQLFINTLDYLKYTDLESVRDDFDTDIIVLFNRHDY